LVAGFCGNLGSMVLPMIAQKTLLHKSFFGIYCDHYGIHYCRFGKPWRRVRIY
jgi:hypothetical protein